LTITTAGYIAWITENGSFPSGSSFLGECQNFGIRSRPAFVGAAYTASVLVVCMEYVMQFEDHHAAADARSCIRVFGRCCSSVPAALCPFIRYTGWSTEHYYTSYTHTTPSCEQHSFSSGPLRASCEIHMGPFTNFSYSTLVPVP